MPSNFLFLFLSQSYEKESKNLIKLPNTSCTAEMLKDEKTIFCKFEEIFVGAECPSINNNLSGKKYKYLYSSGGHNLPPGDKVKYYF